jgi:hypothetical protein
MTEWHDPQADILRYYSLTLFVQPPGSSSPNEVQMFDTKQKRTFLRRTPIDNITLADMVVGGTVTIFARLLKITGYTDQRTKEILMSRRQILTVVLNKEGYQLAGSLFSGVAMAGLTISKCRLIDSMGGPTVVAEIVGDNAAETLEKTCGSMSWIKYSSVQLTNEVSIYFFATSSFLFCFCFCFCFFIPSLYCFPHPR